MIDLVVNKFSWFLATDEKACQTVKVNEYPTLKTVLLIGRKCSLLFNQDPVTKDLWINVIYSKVLQRSAYPTTEINVDFLLIALVKGFKINKRFSSLEEQLDYYSNLIQKNLTSLASPGKSALLRALKLRDEHFESVVKLDGEN
ncbi:hypothetical protein QTP81_01365 [Alteromonas sp. ASW11-36]|uniref:Uncharacterized protein n=1 Tax=Alteromonas arenosi TaxID=3055817 RepID=A0ABT7SST5_9ALTE|nr:hypothetical protein [Alteromonas sp. ASW11-36]MDM7859252.1 hypothetical protein [Alteromonas sp. ASW11-36]